MQIRTVLDQIDLGAMALPEFQRGYVWGRPQVRGLMQSLYQRHPVGGLLVWKTGSDEADARGTKDVLPGFVSLLLDGQQRITTLYGLMKGHPPAFFEGNQHAFTDLHFNVSTESFEFYAPVKMKSDPDWISVTEVFVGGTAKALQKFTADPGRADALAEIIQRIQRLSDIQEIDLHIEEVSGPDKTLDVVVDIFNRVNSGGTKLSKGDLALARICADWPEARQEMHKMLERWADAGYPEFKLDWLLRNVNAIVTGRAEFSFLADRSIEEFKDGLDRAERAVDKVLNLLGARLGLDHGRVLGARGAFPVLCRLVSDRDFQLEDASETDALLYWYVQVMLWGRYAGSVETITNQDLESLRTTTQRPTDALIESLERWRGDLLVRPIDFVAWSKGARFYPLLYMLTRVEHAIDWGNGLELRQQLLGSSASLEVHHIFPKARLYEAGFEMAQVNTLANYTFLTKETNLAVSDRNPAEYLPEFEAKHPGSIASHWIPMDPDLWTTDRYEDFLEARRQVLAAAANSFLSSLRAGSLEGSANAEFAIGSGRASVGADDEASELAAVDRWVSELGLSSGEFGHELTEEDGRLAATLDMAWPAGLQEGLSEPIALLLNEPREVEEAAGRHGFRFFTSIDGFKGYVLGEVEGAAASGHVPASASAMAG